MDARSSVGALLLLAGVGGGVFWALQPGGPPPKEGVMVVLPEGTGVELPVPLVEVQRVPTSSGGDVTAVRLSSRAGFVAVAQQHADGRERIFMGHLSKTAITQVIEVSPETPIEGARLGAPMWMTRPVLLQHHLCVSDGGCTLWRIAAKPSAHSKPLLSEDKTPSLVDRAPNASPDGAALAWIGDGDVWTWPRGAEAPAARTKLGDVTGPLAWSADGRLAFVTGKPGARRIGVLQPGVDAPGVDAPVFFEGGDRRGPAFDEEGRLWWFRSAGVGTPWALTHEGEDGPVVVAENVRLPLYGGVAMSERGDHVGWSTWEEADAGRVFIQRLSDGVQFQVDTGLHHVGDVVMGQGFGQMWLGMAGLPPGAAFRRAAVADVTSIVGEQEIRGTLISGQKKDRGDEPVETPASGKPDGN